MGPMTGRGLGYCAGHAHTGWGGGMGRNFGAGMGRGMGFGRGRWGVGPGAWEGYAPPALDEMEALKAREEILRAELDAVTRRMTEITPED